MKKKLFLKLILLTLPLVMQAQQSSFQKIFDKYSGKEGFTSVYITKYMFELFAKVEGEEEDKEFREVVSRLNSIKIITPSDSLATRQNTEFFKDVTRMLHSLPSGEYKELMIIRDGKEEVKFMIREKDGRITELLMVVAEENESVLIALEGDINLKQVSKLSKSMDVKGLEHLDKVGDTPKK